MGVPATVVFTDLHGSTAAFEALGNALATEAVTHVTNWIADQCRQAQGRVVKTLGDGVLALFPDRESAVRAVVELQRGYHRNAVRGPIETGLPMRVGLASGDVELVGDDCYGDAVNVAARLCDLCGPSQIWADAASLQGVSERPGMTFRTLGPINIRGRAEPCAVYQIEWREEQPSEMLTMQGDLERLVAGGQVDVLGREIELSCMSRSRRFKSFELPIHIGRVRTMEFMVGDPRVSRTHARLDWRNGSVVFVDLSSYGSWIRFSGAGSDVLLRRDECVLHGEGDIALGASFADFSVPTVHFKVY